MGSKVLSTQFIGLNTHFAVNLFAALMSFAVFLLILDAWTARRSRQELLKWLGFLTLTGGFLVAAAATDGSGLLSSGLEWTAGALKLFGLMAIATGQLIDPLQQVPDVSENDVPTLMGQPSEPTKQPLAKKVIAHRQPRTTPHKSTKTQTKSSPAIILAGGLSLPILNGLVVAAAALVAVLYWRRATTGLERHLRPVAWAFALFCLAEIADALTQTAVSRNPLVEQLTADYGPVWWLSQLALTAGAVILGRWVWNYLTKRLLSELFMTLMAQAMIIFMVSTVGFTYLLLNDLKLAQLGDLSTASRVLQYAVSSRQQETIAQAGMAAAGSAMSQAVAARNRSVIAGALSSYYANNQLSTLVVTDAAGVVLWRAQDPERFGDSRSGDPLVRRALVGQTGSDVVVTSGVTSPQVILSAVSPVRDDAGLIVGTVAVGRAIGNAFVDGIQLSTGLASAVYGSKVRAATTLSTVGGDRALGITETNSAIIKTVLEQGQTYAGTSTMQNRTYLTAVSPLKNVNSQPVGMLQAARPASDLFTAAQHSLQLTFLAAVGLLLLSAFPLYRLAAYLESQLK